MHSGGGLSMSKMSHRLGSKVGGKNVWRTSMVESVQKSTHFQSPNENISYRSRKLGLGSVIEGDFNANIPGKQTPMKDTDDRSIGSR